MFHPDSFGYRPGKSAIDAVAKARERCWRYDWVLDLDIKGFFDGIDWELLLKAVRQHTDCAWGLLYIERWLKASVQMEDGRVVPRQAGTPQGGAPRLPYLSPLYAREGAAGQAVVCPLLRGSSPTRGVAPKQHRDPALILSITLIRARGR